MQFVRVHAAFRRSFVYVRLCRLHSALIFVMKNGSKTAYAHRYATPLLVFPFRKSDTLYQMFDSILSHYDAPIREITRRWALSIAQIR